MSTGRRILDRCVSWLRTAASRFGLGARVAGQGGRKTMVVLQWDAAHLDALAVRGRGDGVEAIAATSLDLADAVHPPGRIVREWLEQHRLLGADAVVAVPRSRVDICELKLPPASASELPAIVAAAVALEIPDAGEDSATDYVVLEGGEDGPQEVFAVVADGAVVSDCREQCEMAGLKLKGLVYRPLALASLLPRLTADPPQQAAMVAVRHDEADIVLRRNHHFASARSCRLSKDSSQQGPEQALQELQRTLTVVEPLEDPRIAVLCGNDQIADWKSAAEELALDGVAFYDPASATPGLEDVHDSGRFASLIGAACSCFDGGHELDLLRPKRSPVVAPLWRRALPYAAAALAVLLAAGGWVWRSASQAQQVIQELEDKLDKDRQLLEKMKRKAMVADYVDSWRANDVAWIDELRELSERFPDGDDAVVKRMQMMAAGNGGSIQLQLEVADPEVLAQLEASLRDVRHRVRSKRIAELGGERRYGWAFETRIDLDRRDPEAYSTTETP